MNLTISEDQAGSRATPIQKPHMAGRSGGHLSAGFAIWVWRFALMAALAALLTGGGFLLPTQASLFLRSHRVLHHVALNTFYLLAALAGWMCFSSLGKERWGSLAEVRLARAVPHVPLGALAILTAGYGALKIAGLVLRHEAFFTAVWDFASYDNMIWNILHGNMPRTWILSAGVLAPIEPRYILYLIAPLFLIWDHACMLLIFSGLAATAAVPILYGLARRLARSSGVALAFAFAWVFDAPVTALVRDDFHAGSLANPLLLAGFWAAAAERWKLSLLFYALALTCTESVTLCVLGAALFYLTSPKTRRHGTWLLSAIAVFLAVAALTPLFGFGQPTAPTRWNMVRIFFLPSDWLPYLQTRLADPLPSVWMIVALLAPFAFFALFSARGILLLMPILAFHLAIPNPGFRDPTAHYMEGITAMTALASVWGFLAWTNRAKDPGGRRRNALAALLAASLLLAGPAEPFYLERLWDELSGEYLQWERWAQATPQSYSVRATPMLAAHLAHRRALYQYGDPFSGDSPELGLNKEVRARNLRPDAWPDLIWIDRTRDLNFWTLDPEFIARGWDWAVELDHFRQRGYRLVFESASKKLQIYASPRLDRKTLDAYVRRLEKIGREIQYSLRKVIRRRASRFALKGFWFAPQDFQYSKKKSRRVPL